MVLLTHSLRLRYDEDEETDEFMVSGWRWHDADVAHAVGAGAAAVAFTSVAHAGAGEAGVAHYTFCGWEDPSAEGTFLGEVDTYDPARSIWILNLSLGSFYMAMYDDVLPGTRACPAYDAGGSVFRERLTLQEAGTCVLLVLLLLLLLLIRPHACIATYCYDYAITTHSPTPPLRYYVSVVGYVPKGHGASGYVEFLAHNDNAESVFSDAVARREDGGWGGANMFFVMAFICAVAAFLCSSFFMLRPPASGGGAPQQARPAPGRAVEMAPYAVAHVVVGGPGGREKLAVATAVPVPAEML